jgi:hypothetical protein
MCAFDFIPDPDRTKKHFPKIAQDFPAHIASLAEHFTRRTPVLRPARLRLSSAPSRVAEFISDRASQATAVHPQAL